MNPSRRHVGLIPTLEVDPAATASLLLECKFLHSLPKHLTDARTSINSYLLLTIQWKLNPLLLRAPRIPQNATLFSAHASPIRCHAHNVAADRTSGIKLSSYGVYAHRNDEKLCRLLFFPVCILWKRFLAWIFFLMLSALCLLW